MNVFWTYRVPTLKKDRIIHIHASLNHGYVRKIILPDYTPERDLILQSEIMELPFEYPYMIFNFLNYLIKSQQNLLNEQLSFSTSGFQLKILQDYFTILEIMKQIKLLAFYYHDKALYQTTTLFFSENAFNEKILKRLSAHLLNPEKNTLNTILTIKDIFFLYDLIMGYEKEKEKEGKGYLVINHAVFQHFHKHKKILPCHFYDNDFIKDPNPEWISVPEYRKKLLNDLKIYLQVMKHDLEILSGKEEENGSQNIAAMQTYPESAFHYGKIHHKTNHQYLVEYLYDRYFQNPRVFYGLHHEALEFIFFLMNFTIIEKEYS
ncbi:MAG: hypothetical protein PWP06_648 [Candidatus Marinimicrobia bacterium]|jgi:hypothetical protein|nr:hypothetical protein [Candidatus Neomarinimicrobiota bacterium]